MLEVLGQDLVGELVRLSYQEHVSIASSPGNLWAGREGW